MTGVVDHHTMEAYGDTDIMTWASSNDEDTTLFDSLVDECVGAGVFPQPEFDEDTQTWTVTQPFRIGRLNAKNTADPLGADESYPLDAAPTQYVVQW